MVLPGGIPADDPSHELQTKLFTTLSAALSVPVRDNVEEGTSKPYVTIGEAVSTPDNSQDRFGWSILETIHVWDKSRGYKDALAIAKTIIATLDHRQSAVEIGSPWHIVSIRYEQLLTLRDPDPEIRHVPVQFRIDVEQEN